MTDTWKGLGYWDQEEQKAQQRLLNADNSDEREMAMDRIDFCRMAAGKAAYPSDRRAER